MSSWENCMELSDANKWTLAYHVRHVTKTPSLCSRSLNSQGFTTAWMAKHKEIVATKLKKESTHHSIQGCASFGRLALLILLAVRVEKQLK